jgi:hypothetical protein
MKRKRIIIVAFAMFVFVFSSCSSSKYGMKRVRHKKCNCPTFSWRASDDRGIEMVSVVRK